MQDFISAPPHYRQGERKVSFGALVSPATAVPTVCVTLCTVAELDMSSRAQHQNRVVYILARLSVLTENSFGQPLRHPVRRQRHRRHRWASTD